LVISTVADIDWATFSYFQPNSAKSRAIWSAPGDAGLGPPHASAVIDDHLLVGDPDRQCRHHDPVLPLGIRKLT